MADSAHCSHSATRGRTNGGDLSPCAVRQNLAFHFFLVTDAFFRLLYRLGAMTADLASLFRSAIERGGIELVVDVEEDPLIGQPVYLA